MGQTCQMYFHAVTQTFKCEKWKMQFQNRFLLSSWIFKILKPVSQFQEEQRLLIEFYFHIWKMLPAVYFHKVFVHEDISFHVSQRLSFTLFTLH